MKDVTTLFARLTADPRSDRVLLAAFVEHGDQSAFDTIVQRYSRLVWGACRRGLSVDADAEDAFQATFLIFIRRADRLNATDSIGPWLYRVAVWTARNLRRKNARRLALRRALPETLPDPRADVALRFDLDDALLQLPERARTAVVLCHLQGFTLREAADRLGCAEGTVSSLISRGLSKLRARLAQDPLAVLALAAIVAVPAQVPAAAIRASTASQVATIVGGTSPAVLQLTQGVLRMFWIKKATATMIAATMLIAAGMAVGVSVRQTPIAGADDPAQKTLPKAHTDSLDQLNADIRRLKVEEEKLTRDREQIERRMKLLVDQAKAIKEKETDQTSRMVITVGGRTSLPPVTLTEYRNGKPFCAVTFPEVTWQQLNWSPVREYLVRWIAEQSTSKEITFYAEPASPYKHLQELMKICQAIGIEKISERTIPEPVTDKTSPLEVLRYRFVKPLGIRDAKAGVQVQIVNGGATAVSANGTEITLPLDGSAIVTLNQREIMGVKVMGSSVHAAREPGRVKITGLKSGTGTVVLFDDQDVEYPIQVTITTPSPVPTAPMPNIPTPKKTMIAKSTVTVFGKLQIWVDQVMVAEQLNPKEIRIVVPVNATTSIKLTEGKILAVRRSTLDISTDLKSGQLEITGSKTANGTIFLTDEKNVEFQIHIAITDSDKPN